MAIKAKLTTFDTTMIVVSLVIGIGIFRTPAMVADATGTPFRFFAAWTLGGLISLLGALTFAEIGSRFPRPGAYYKVVAESYHSSLAFMFNWAGILIANGAGAAAVGIIGAEYLVPILVPSRYQSQFLIQLTAALVIFFLFVINYLGIKSGAWAQNVLTLLKIGMILLLVFIAFYHRTDVPVGNFSQSGPIRPFWMALGIGLIAVFYTQGGYQNTINFGADMKNARRNMPLAILSGMLIIIACYLLINAAYYRVLGISGIAGAKLVAAEVARATFGNFGYLFVSLVIFFSAMGFLNATFLQLPRAYYAMAEDNTLPAIFMKVNQKTQAQEFTLIFFTATVLLSIFFLGTFENIVNYVMFVDALSIAVVASTIFVLRKKAKTEKIEYDGYRAPLYPVLPAVFVLFLVFVSLNVLWNETRSALLGALIFASGYPIFRIMRRITRKQEWRGDRTYDLASSNETKEKDRMDTITKDELLEKIRSHESFHLVDVRDTPDYRKEHIASAVHLLISEMKSEKVEAMFHKQDLIVTYSLDIDCPAKNIAAQKLIDFGFTNVRAYPGSWKEWREAGYPVEEG